MTLGLIIPNSVANSMGLVYLYNYNNTMFRIPRQIISILHVQWSLRITDTLGKWLLSVVESCQLLGDYLSITT